MQLISNGLGYNSIQPSTPEVRRLEITKTIRHATSSISMSSKDASLEKDIRMKKLQQKAMELQQIFIKSQK